MTRLNTRVTGGWLSVAAAKHLLGEEPEVSDEVYLRQINVIPVPIDEMVETREDREGREAEEQQQRDQRACGRTDDVQCERQSERGSERRCGRGTCGMIDRIKCLFGNHHFRLQFSGSEDDTLWNICIFCKRVKWAGRASGYGS